MATPRFELLSSSKTVAAATTTSTSNGEGKDQSFVHVVPNQSKPKLQRIINEVDAFALWPTPLFDIIIDYIASRCTVDPRTGKQNDYHVLDDNDDNIWCKLFISFHSQLDLINFGWPNVL
jgi:hypothetical protein